MPNRRTGRSGPPAISADTAGSPADDSGDALPDAGNTESPHRLTIPEIGDLTRESAPYFREMVNALPAAIYTTDANGRVTSFNAAAVELSGRSPEVGTDTWCVSWKLYRPDGTLLPHAECPMAVALREGRAIRGAEIIVERPDGRRLWCEAYPTPLRDAAGRIVGGVNMLMDVTARRRGDEALARLAAIVESSDDAIVSKDLNGIITSWNTGAERLFGYTAEEIVGQPITLLVPPARYDEEADILARIRRGEMVDHFETVRRRKDGTLLNVSVTISPIRNGQGMVTGASKIARDISERKRTEEALRDVSRRKDEFLAMLAHELRNPLAPIRHALDILRRARQTESATAPAAEQSDRNPEARGASGHGSALDATLGVLDRQFGQMERLVDDLLDAGRISRGKLDLRRERVELSAVVDAAVEAVRPQYDSASLELIVTLPPRRVYIDADPARLSQIVGNLLNNACKFTDRGGSVWLTAELEGGDVIIRVRDTGIGIARDDLTRVFDMFTQVDASLERSRTGLGIGLTLVSTLAQLHGGAVTVHSDGIGRGSEFVVRLPILADVPVALPAAGAPQKTARATLRILVVDDNRDAAESLAMLLRFGGHEIHVAYDGPGAVQAAADLRPDAVLLDIGLPGLNGYEVAGQIRRRQGARPVLLALTGWGQDSDRRRSEEAGFDAHLVKPVDHAELGRLLVELGAGDLNRRP